jgi:hypothetical protein
MRNLTQYFTTRRILAPSLGLWLGIGLLAGACETDADADGDREKSTLERGGPVTTCLDVDPDYNTGFAGDELCLAEPEADEPFIVLRYGPLDYEDQEDVDRFILTPEEEEATNCQAWKTPNKETVYTQGYYLTARPGTHHIIVYRGENTFRGIEDGEIPDREARGTDMSFMVGAQSGLGPDGLILDTRTTEAEYEGWAGRLPPERQICYEAHYVNVSPDPILRESWVRFNLLPEEEVTTYVEPIFFLGGLGMAVQPGAHEIIKGRCEQTHDEPVRIMGWTGHMHAAGERQTVWRVDNDGNREKLYETFDWEEPINAEYNTIQDNPEFDEVAKTDGAVSGPVWVQPGEVIEWECEFINRTEGVLRFGNGAYTAEMCNVFGFYGPGYGEGPWRCINF